MKILKFKVGGNTAFFRSNELNDGDVTFSYGHIHKPALLGLLGAILGLSGHNQGYYKDKKKYIHPEFYTILSEIKISIVPKAKNGFYNRKIQGMVNACGYSQNKDTRHGQTLMYSEQWLENPYWDVYINLDTISDIYLKDKLVDYILNSKMVYMPYLGKTNHPAVISEGEVVEGLICEEEISKIGSLFKINGISKYIDFLDDDDSIFDSFEYREKLPSSYEENNCYYKTDTFVFSNKKFNDNGSCDFIKVGNIKLFFY